MHDSRAGPGLPVMLKPVSGEEAVEVAVEVEGGDVVLFAEGVATQRSDVVVLLAGAAMQATTWEDTVVAELVDHGLGVIRFDWRDIGRSTWRTFKEHPYPVDTLAGDVVAIVDALDLAQFHLVGFSMGGCVAQLVALTHRKRVKSSVLVSSGYASVIDVPRPERGRVLFELFALPRPESDEQMIERLVEQWRLLCGPGTRFDEPEWAARARAWVDRGQNPACPHVRLGPQVFGVDRDQALRSLDLPTLVLHGSDDPMFPVGHGERLAAVLPDASMQTFDGRGHDLHLHPSLPGLITRHIDAIE